MALRAQLLDGRAPLTGKEGVARAIDHLGYVQIDTIAAVARAHHHTLWTRCPDYTPAILHDLQAAERRVFEYWAHAIAYLPLSDYRYYTPRMDRIRAVGPAWLRAWREEHRHVLEEVRRRIETEGALTSKDFEPPPGTRRGTWWDWKPAKRALEILFWQGDLMISERRNFQKVYDLTERILPADVDTTRPTPEELGGFHVRRALSAMGLAREREIVATLHVVKSALVAETLAGMLESRGVLRLSIEGIDEPYYTLPGALDGDPAAAPPDRARILSPFDSLIIQRDRIERLFGFSYALECYLPAAKRKHGYFVLPILWRDRLIGRLDPKADRKTETLIVRNLVFEPGFTEFDAALPAFAEAVASFAHFNRCEQITFDRITPTGHKRRLNSLVKQALSG